MLIIACFIFSFTTIATVNYAFDDYSTVLSVEVLDKDVLSSTRGRTSFYFEIEIGETRTKIDVPADVYHTTEVGEYIEINLYNGALGYSYYIYEH